MSYDQVAHFVKFGGTLFFFMFFCVMFVFVFWRSDAESPLRAALPALGVFVAITALIMGSAFLGNAPLLIVTLILVAVFIYTMRFFKSVDDDRFGDIADLPLQDEGPIVDQL